MLLFGLIKLKKTPKLIKLIKTNIMYSSIFRGQIQFFFPTCLASFIILTQCSKENQFKECENISALVVIQAIFKLMFMSLIPIFSFIHLKKNFFRLESETFQIKFISLYENLFPIKKSVYW